jgi:hypothetical protein
VGATEWAVEPEDERSHFYPFAVSGGTSRDDRRQAA